MIVSRCELSVKSNLIDKKLLTVAPRKMKLLGSMAHYVTGWRSADNSDSSRPATEVDYLVKVQVIDFCRLHSVCRNKNYNIEPKVEERLPSARIFANLPVGEVFISSESVSILIFLSKQLAKRFVL